MFKAILVCLCLTGCAQPAPFLHVCPSLPTYSATFDRQAGEQLQALPDGSALAQMIEDYVALRHALKECSK